MSITRPHDGAGLGLPICKGLAKLLGGDISIVSELGRGTEFILTVPIKITMG
jgi:signal transduction histidine kinase